MTNRKIKNQHPLGGRPERHLGVRGIRREPLDVRKLSKVLLAMALAEAEAEQAAQAEHERRTPPTTEASA